MSALSKVAYDFFNSDEVLRAADKIKDGKTWMQYVKTAIEPSVAEFSEREVEFIIAMIVSVEMQRHPEREQKRKYRSKNLKPLKK